MKNKKGFTLIELIVAIAIMGVLLIITLPQVVKIQEENKYKKYEAYQESIERAAKLYTDSNSKDMFKYYANGCYIVEYSYLKEANLIKDFSEEDINCDGGDGRDTFVAVTKVNDEYSYATNLVCIKGEDSTNQVYKTVTPVSKETCQLAEDNIQPDISVSPVSTGVSWVKTSDIKITVSDKKEDDNKNLGLNKNVSLKYQWVIDGKNPDPKKWKRVDFKNKKYEEEVNYTIPKKNLPKDTGKYNLHIDASEVMDAVGNKATSPITKGPYNFDNSPPTIPTSEIRQNNLNGTILTNSNNWRNYTVWWGNFIATDIGSGIKRYEYQQNCKGDVKTLNQSSYTYSNINTSYCIRAVDNLENVSEWSEPYYFKIDTVVPTVTLTTYEKTSSANLNASSNVSSLNVYTKGNNQWYSGYTFTKITSSAGASGATVTCTDSRDEDTSKTFNSFKNVDSEGSTTLTCSVVSGAGTPGATVTKIIRLDRTKPTCKTKKSNKNTTDGVTATFNCSDSLFEDGTRAGLASGVCPSQQTNLRSDASYNFADAAGNVGTCSVDVSSKTQYYKASCSTGKRCADAGCETYNSGTGKVCGEGSRVWVCDTGESDCYVNNVNKCIRIHSSDIDAGKGYCKNSVITGSSYTSWYWVPYKSCRNSSFGCNTYNRSASECGCSEWGNYSWNDSDCGSGTGNTCKRTDTRRVYY